MSKYDLQKNFGVTKNVEDKFKSISTNYDTRPIVSNYRDQILCVDLIDLTKNDDFDYNYLMIGIDCYTRFVFSVWLDRKDIKNIKDALQMMFKDMKALPDMIYTDGESAVYSKEMQIWFKSLNIIVYQTYGKTHNPIAERVIRTLKGIVEKVVEGKKTNKNIKMTNEEIFEKAVDTYNDTVHRTIKVKPIDAYEGTDEKVLRTLKDAWDDHVNAPRSNGKKYIIGDVVRVTTTKVTFQKGYTKKYSDSLFTIIGIDKTNPVTYELQSNKDKSFKCKNFYAPELMLVKKYVEPPKPVFKHDKNKTNAP